MVKTYVKKPLEIQAIQWTGDNNEEVLEFGSGSIGLVAVETYSTLCINTLEGDMFASIGDYIIRGIKGEYYACKPDVFDQTYEEVV